MATHAFAPRRKRRTGAGWVAYTLLAVIILISLAPFYWQVVIASNTQAAIGQSPPAMLPGGHLWQHIRIVFQNADFGKALLNSLIVCTIITVSVVLSSTLAGFAFAKLRFRGRGALLIFVVATMTIPTQLGIIPLYIMMAQWFGWNDHLAAVIVPALVNAFGVFFMRQYLVDVIPEELIEAARVDGANMIRTFWHVGVPAARPAMAILGLFTFMTAWTDYLWPLLVAPQNPTLQVALSQLQSAKYVDYSIVLAGAVLATIPLLILFVLAGKQLVSGIMAGAVKG